MFRKVLKHDIKSILNFWLMMTSTVLALSVVGGLCFRGIDLMSGNQKLLPFIPLLMLGVFVSIIAMSVYGVGTVVLLMVRFYKNFFTDEGYLTFTLPVKRSTLFNSKLLTSFIYNTATAIVLVVSATVMMGIAPGIGDSATALGGVIESIKSTFEWIKPFMDKQVVLWVVLYSIAAILYVLVMFVHETLLIFCAVTFGSLIAKKHKIIASVGVYYAVETILQIFWSIVSTVLSFGIEAISISHTVEAATEVLLLLLLLILYYVMIIALLACLYYKFAVQKLRGNLNLA